ncbi:uncharacterized protein DUF4292 [Mucilaginibacter gracilis]|uniref:Uncharacterized protein DUF4292 n=1 Tax=Mucilaginibacter gracilis TaxID=423350 RepID=A0A495J9V9_9SPHI|nr:DUF4292 domain-containing protein [Mucilaginibacter gracilis]RKR85593.1 uncharacterized protein DUF4292 [Mucilaginibacter gracilis]
MRKNTLNKLAVVLCLLALFSCKSKKYRLVSPGADTTAVVDTPAKAVSATVSGSTPAAAATNAAVVTTPPVKPAIDNFKLEKLKSIRLKQVDFNTFSGKAQTKLSVNGDSHDVTFTVRIKKDQQIWVSITAVLGVEVARALITPDSIKLMNRLESTYLKKPFSYIYSYTSKQLNYKTLEALIIGNAVPELVNDNANLKASNGDVILNGNLQDLVYQLTVGPDLRVIETNMANHAGGQSLHVFNAAFIQAGSHVMPSKVNISSSVGDKNIQAELHYTKVDFDQTLSYPFSVPARFKLTN